MPWDYKTNGQPKKNTSEKETNDLYGFIKIFPPMGYKTFRACSWECPLHGLFPNGFQVTTLCYILLSRSVDLYASKCYFNWNKNTREKYADRHSSFFQRKLRLYTQINIHTSENTDMQISFMLLLAAFAIILLYFLHKQQKGN